MFIGITTLSGCKEEANTSTTTPAATQQQSQPQTTTSQPKASVPAESVFAPDDNAPKIGTKVLMKTSMGDIVIGLYDTDAPITTKNFLGYVQAGHYNNTIFHRVINRFMIQGGGFTPDMQKKATRAPIINESYNKIRNTRGTIAMARTSNPNSATCQFFINHKNNTPLDYQNAAQPGYAVFGEVVSGMDVVDNIAMVPTGFKNRMKDVPVEAVIIESINVTN